MSLFTPWAESPEFVAAKKIVNDHAKRIATVKADIARMKPKISTYKKETLEKLVKENQAKLAVVLKLNQEIKEPENVYMLKVRTKAKKLLTELKKSYDQRVKEIELEEKNETNAAFQFKANGGGKGGGSGGITALLCDQYEAMQKMLKAELAIATNEKSPSADRKV